MTADDLATLVAGLAAGKRVTVYLREPMPSLGLDAGTSARVIGIDGSTVTLRPKGVDDELPFEAEELRMTRAATASSTTKTRRRPTRTAVDAPEPSGLKPTASLQPTANSTTALPRPASRRDKQSAPAVTVAITSSDMGAWSVSVSRGSKKQGKPVEVSAARVARAMRELGDDTAVSAVDGVITSARASAERRVAELCDELEHARAALADLDGE